MQSIGSSESNAAPGLLTGRLRDEVDAALAAAVEFSGDCPPELVEAIRYALLSPGKRLRPQLVLLAAQACGGDHRAALPAATAVEMIHAYSLVHDDLPAMDNDDLRRGRPTCHKQFDEATAILVGDALQARAFEILATQVEPPATALACCRELAAAAGAEALVGGQADDLAAENRHLGLEGLESVHRRKTGALIRASVRLGGLTAGAADEPMAALDAYGQHLGLAFQVVDDLLDVAGSEGSVGKKVGKDRAHGKVTYPVLLGVEASRQRVTDLIDLACNALAPLGSAAQPLEQVAVFVGNRNR